MSLSSICAQGAIFAAERLPLPDGLLRFGIDQLCDMRRREISTSSNYEAQFAREMANFPIAQHVDAANEQHYELPPRFFELTLGPRRKYSCCKYPTGTETLADAEDIALAETMANAGLADGQAILELGCGWGSLSLTMASRLPNARIVAVSNSAPQRAYIEGEAQRAGLTNLTVITADMNAFDPRDHLGGVQGEWRFDRVVSVEMFEHMSNWRELLARVHGWLKPDGRLFLHVFSHRSHPYRFDTSDPTDWIAQHFFTGGIMPSHGLLEHFTESFTVENKWLWSGTHYQRTANQWLARFDSNRTEIDAVLREVYGADAELWRRRWRLFYLATAGLWGHAGGKEWGVTHALLKPISEQAT